MAPEGFGGFESHESGRDKVMCTAGPSVILQVALRMADSARARAEGIPSFAIRAWLAGLSQRAAFRDDTTGLAPAPERLLEGLALLAGAARSDVVGDLLVGALHSYPLGGGQDPAGGHDRLFLTALVLLIGPEPPTEAEVATLVHGFEALAGRVDRRGPEGLGLRFLTLATELAIGVRCDGPVALLARQLHDLGTIAARAAGGLLLALDAAEQHEERIRAALSDPAFAMRLHTRVPRRSMTASADASVRKDFALADPLADQARTTLEAAAAGVIALRADIATLNGLERALQAEAAAVLTRR